MLINDNQPLYALFKDGVRISQPTPLNEAMQLKMQKDIQEQQAISIMPVTSDGRLLLNG